MIFSRQMRVASAVAKLVMDLVKAMVIMRTVVRDRVTPAMVQVSR